jgi:hypothetical protein
MEAVITDPDTVWLIGGYNEEQDALDSTNKFVISGIGYEHISGPSLNQARKEHMAAQLDTVIYVFGGTGEHDQVLESVEALVDVVVDDSCASAVDIKAHSISSFRLKQNYPNPFNASTTIEFELASEEQVHLALYSAHGRLVKTVVENRLSPGRHRYRWDGTHENGEQLPSGIYFYKLLINEETHTRKMLLVK